MSYDQPAIIGAAELTPGRKVPYTSTEMHVRAAVAALADAVDEARAAGAKGWLAKPFQTAQLLDAVNKLCI